jgi:hypothetical protein
MPSIGQVVDQGTEKSHAWKVTYVGGVGTNGVGVGIYRWYIEISDRSGTVVTFGYVAGDDPGPASRCAKHWAAAL